MAPATEEQIIPDSAPKVFAMPVKEPANLRIDKFLLNCYIFFVKKFFRVNFFGIGLIAQLIIV